MTDSFENPHCGSCPIRNAADRLCRTKDGKAPKDCPTANHAKLTEEVFDNDYAKNAEQLRFAKNAAMVEKAGYTPLPDGSLQATTPRIVEIVHFAKRMGYKKIGLIFCFGLRNEGEIVTKVLETNGFEVVSACCKVGNVPKTSLGLTSMQQLSPNGPEPMCNPTMQAELMNKAKVDFNVMLGLCVGHDSLALKTVEAPVTVLAVKDRMMGHNPLAAIYMYNSYMSYLKKPLTQFDNISEETK